MKHTFGKVPLKFDTRQECYMCGKQGTVKKGSLTKVSKYRSREGTRKKVLEAAKQWKHNIKDYTHFYADLTEFVAQYHRMCCAYNISGRNIQFSGQSEENNKYYDSAKKAFISVQSFVHDTEVTREQQVACKGFGR